MLFTLYFEKRIPANSITLIKLNCLLIIKKFLNYIERYIATELTTKFSTDDTLNLLVVCFHILGMFNFNNTTN